MKILITGGAKNGKSSLAQDLAVTLSGEGKRYYVATMIPHDEEDRERIRRHIADRAGLSFETVECGLHIDAVPGMTGGKGAYLLDSVTALLSNEMFADGKIDETAAQRIAPELISFLRGTEHAVLVFDGIFADADPYDPLTEAYRQGLADLQRLAAQECDLVVEMYTGCPVVLKGKLPIQAAESPGQDGKADPLMKAAERKEADSSDPGRRSSMEFVLGGAGQGKTAYITEKYGFAEAEITEASEDAATDLSARCITHIERYVRYCMKNGIEPEFSFTKDAVIAGDDIFCGIVPMEPEIRAWREACGRYMTRLANMAEHVTRVSCGIPQTLK